MLSPIWRRLRKQSSRAILAEPQEIRGTADCIPCSRPLGARRAAGLYSRSGRPAPILWMTVFVLPETPEWRQHQCSLQVLPPESGPLIAGFSHKRHCSADPENPPIGIVRPASRGAKRWQLRVSVGWGYHPIRSQLPVLTRPAVNYQLWYCGCRRPYSDVSLWHPAWCFVDK